MCKCDEDDREPRSIPVTVAERPPSDLGATVVFEALTDQRRRFLCHALRTSPRWDLGRLAATIAAWESDSPVSTVPDRERERLYLSLYHSHVPALAALDVVDFEGHTETVTQGERFDEVTQMLAYLESSRERRDRE